jgi:probable rRNA maturation factor
MMLVIAASPRLGHGASRARLAPLLRAVAAGVPPRRAAVEVTWVGERAMARLNRTYRGRVGAPEILTFPFDGGVDPGGEGPLGTICLSWDRIAAAARGRGVSTRAYAARLLVHGLLHLRGFGHADARSEARMEEAEARELRGHVSSRELERLFA